MQRSVYRLRAQALPVSSARTLSDCRFHSRIWQSCAEDISRCGVRFVCQPRAVKNRHGLGAHVDEQGFDSCLVRAKTSDRVAQRGIQDHDVTASTHRNDRMAWVRITVARS